MQFEGDSRRFTAPRFLFLMGACLLALQPLLWLIGTWREPAYNSQGLWIALVTLSLAVWSYLSEAQPGSDMNHRYAYGLLAGSAAVRILGQVLRVNVIGALTLAVDVYALGTLAGLHQRRRAVSPAWLALLFAFSLPLERVVQRLIGYGLQQVSASGACTLLGWVTGGVQCLGNRILLEGQDVLVDLPCAGSHGLLLVLMLFASLAAVVRPRPWFALAGFAIALVSALIANMLRIALLALGLAQGYPLMEAPWHEMLGLFTLALSAAPVMSWARWASRARAWPSTPALMPAPPLHLDDARGQRKVRRWAAGFLALAVVAVSLPAHPVDVARAVPAPQIPLHVGGYNAQARALNPLEQQYFTQYGGGAARAIYGPYALLMVSTAAPLRHLHSPDECLTGAGHQVRYVGLAQGALPTAIYRSTDSMGQVWRVSVSYVSERGDTAASIAHVIWQWLKAPGSRWTMVQRIAPWELPDTDVANWDRALLRALDLPDQSDSSPQTLHLAPNT